MEEICLGVVVTIETEKDLWEWVKFEGMLFHPLRFEKNVLIKYFQDLDVIFMFILPVEVADMNFTVLLADILNVKWKMSHTSTYHLNQQVFIEIESLEPIQTP